MTKHGISLIVRTLVVLMELGTTGCVHSYYALRVNNQQKIDDCAKCCDNGLVILDSVRLDTTRTIFYSRDFEYIHRESDGDWLNPWLEAICRFPTVMIEVPFFMLNCDTKDVSISIKTNSNEVVSGDGGFDRHRVPWYLMDDRNTTIAITNEQDCVCSGAIIICIDDASGEAKGKSHETRLDMTYRCVVASMDQDTPIGGGRLFDWVYFSSQDECYALAEIQYETLSFCGISVEGNGPVPFLWRIDLKTGKRDAVAWLDKGKILKKRDDVLVIR